MVVGPDHLGLGAQGFGAPLDLEVALLAALESARAFDARAAHAQGRDLHIRTRQAVGGYDLPLQLAMVTGNLSSLTHDRECSWVGAEKQGAARGFVAPTLDRRGPVRRASAPAYPTRAASRTACAR